MCNRSQEQLSHPAFPMGEEGEDRGILIKLHKVLSLLDSLGGIKESHMPTEQVTALVVIHSGEGQSTSGSEM